MRGLAFLAVLVVAASGCFSDSPTRQPNPDAPAPSDPTSPDGSKSPPVSTPPKGQGSSPTSPLAAPRIHVVQDRNVVQFNFTWAATAIQVVWEFGDGHTSNATSPQHTYVNMGTYDVVLRVDGPTVMMATTRVDINDTPFQPRVVVAVADSGINPYHEIYRRADLTAHPCTYVEGYACDIPALPLSIGIYDDWQDAFNADKELWDSIQLDQWYWIPGTNIIGAACDSPEGGGATAVLDEGAICILDDSNMHGTGTTSSVLMEAPEALLLVSESSSLATAMEFAPVIPDIQSHSWGPPAPLPLHAVYVTESEDQCGFGQYFAQTLFFQAAGNEALWPAPADFARFCPSAIVIGGATSRQGEVGSWTFYDFASWYCRPTAQTNSIDEYRASYCGTSFSTPTAAGTAAAALLEIRRLEGYTGGNTATMVSHNVTRDAFVHAMRWSATYAPQATYSTGNGYAPIPLVPGQEYLVWGWGFLDKQVVPTFVACAFGTCPDKDPMAVAWNEARHDLREAVWEPA